MIPHGVDVFVGLDPIDLRWSFDRLCGLVTEKLGREPRGGAMFLFFGRRRDALPAKVVNHQRAAVGFHLKRCFIEFS